MSAKLASPPPLYPDEGTTAGGTLVTITDGVDRDEETVMGTQVMFGEVAGRAVNGKDPSDDPEKKGMYKSVSVTSPTHNAGEVFVFLIPPGSPKEKIGKFKYSFEVESVYPKSAKVIAEKDWDVVALIKGNDMSDVQAVYFGDVATRFGLISPSYIWAIVPYPSKPIPPDPVKVKVKTSRGEDESQTFKYEPFHPKGASGP
jgi:hypothetical protein